MTDEQRLCATHLALDLLERGNAVDAVAEATGLPVLIVGDLRRRSCSNPAHDVARARLRQDLNRITKGNA